MEEINLKIIKILIFFKTKIKINSKHNTPNRFPKDNQNISNKLSKINKPNPNPNY